MNERRESHCVGPQVEIIIGLVIWSDIAIAVTMVIECFHHVLNNDLAAPQSFSRRLSRRVRSQRQRHHESRLPPAKP